MFSFDQDTPAFSVRREWNTHVLDTHLLPHAPHQHCASYFHRQADVISPTLRKVRSESGPAKIGLEVFVASVGCEEGQSLGRTTDDGLEVGLRLKDEKWNGFGRSGA
jgi:hypothetical protein